MENQNLPGTRRDDVSIGDWMITIFIKYIPLIGLIMLFVWAFGDGAPASKKNWAIASLIWGAIWLVLGIILVILFWALFASMLSSGMHTYS